MGSAEEKDATFLRLGDGMCAHVHDRQVLWLMINRKNAMAHDQSQKYICLLLVLANLCPL